MKKVWILVMNLILLTVTLSCLISGGYIIYYNSIQLWTMTFVVDIFLKYALSLLLGLVLFFIGSFIAFFCYKEHESNASFLKF